MISKGFSSLQSLIQVPYAGFARTRRAKSYIPKKYKTLPPWRVPNYEDPHSYKLRSFDEVLKEQEEHPPNIVMEMVYSYHPWCIGLTSYKNRKAKVGFQIPSMKLTGLQRKRLIYLLGPRIKPDSQKFYLSCESFPSYEENLKKIFEQSRELYWEAKRAP